VHVAIILIQICYKATIWVQGKTTRASRNPQASIFLLDTTCDTHACLHACVRRSLRKPDGLHFMP
jgi:hypothetical protein